MKPKIVIGVIIILVALVYLIVGGIKDSALYYMTVKELYASESIPYGQGMRICGYAVPETINWNADKIQLTFALAEEGDTLQVVYDGIIPDRLADAQEVIVEGTLDSAGVLTANKLLLKCPSKYEVADEEEGDRGY